MAAALLRHTSEGVTIAEAAERLGVSVQTVRNWIRTGKLPATRFGPADSRIIRIDPADLEHIGPRPATEGRAE